MTQLIRNEPEGTKYLALLLDITHRCTLRCRHCFYFRDARSKSEDFPSGRFLERVDELQKHYGAVAALWEGGEPMLRKDVLAPGVEKFAMNVIPTNGTIPIPRLPKSKIVVALDGPEKINDMIRGRGSYRRAIKNTARNVAETDNTIHFQCTICRLNQDFLEALVIDRIERNITKLLFTFYVPENGERSEFGWNTNEERDPMVERVLNLKNKYPDFILNTVAETECMFSDKCAPYTSNCFLKANVLPIKANLEERMFCCYGDNPDCERCGSWAVFHYANLKIRRQETGDRGQ
jgi:sulfatase maturation enzyme AslB (radical SAM superfamily)